MRSVPKRVRIVGTLRCNMACSFCYETLRTVKSMGEIDTEQMLKIVDRVVEAKVPIVRLSGGEFTLRSDLKAILRYLREVGLNIGLNTNGIITNEDACEAISECVHMVLISLPGYDEESTYRVTGVRGSFEKKLQLAHRLALAGVGVRFSTVTTRTNILNIERFHEVIQNARCGEWMILREVPTNIVDSANVDDYRRLALALGSFNEADGTKLTIKNEIPFCACERDILANVLPPENNGGPHEDLTVLPDGSVIPTPSLNEILGNLTTMSVQDCWTSDFALRWRELDFLPKICRKCPIVIQCKGGHRVAALRVNGNLDGLDPLAVPSNVATN